VQSEKFEDRGRRKKPRIHLDKVCVGKHFVAKKIQKLFSHFLHWNEMAQQVFFQISQREQIQVIICVHSRTRL
jgi:hypothetical protein